MLLLLDATTKSIEAVSSSGPTDIVFVAAYADSTSSAFTEGSSDGAVSTVDTTVVSAPSASTRRVIKSINFYNTAGSARTVTLKYNNNGTKRTIVVFTLAAGENWSTDDLGGGGGISSLTVGSTPVTGTNGSVLYVNGSVLGEVATTGTGNIVRASSPSLTTPNLGTPSAATLTNATGLPLTTGVTGTLPVGNGGTGATSLTANNVLLGNGTSALQVVAPGTSGNVLTSDGTTWTSAAPTGGGGGREVLTAARTYYIGFDLGAVTANATLDVIEKTAHGLENNDPVVFSAATAPDGITLGAVYYVINKTTNNFEISTTVGGSKVTWTTNGTTVTCYTGNDSNSGYGTNGRTVAFLTVQKFFNTVATIDKAGYNVTGTLCAGLFVAPLTLNVQTGVGSGRCILTGASNTTSVIQGRCQDSVMVSDSQIGFQTGSFKLERDNTATTGSSVVTLPIHGLNAGDAIVFYGSSAPTNITFGTTYYVLSTDLTANSFKFATSVGGSVVAVGSGTVQVRRSTSFDVLLENRNGATLFLTGMNFGARPTATYGAHLWIQSSQVRPIGDWTISGGGPGDFLLVTGNGTFSGFSLESSITVTITGSPSFTSGAFVRAQRCGVAEIELRTGQNRLIFSGSIGSGAAGATALNGVISTFNSGIGLPGTLPITSTGGQTN